MIKLTAFVRRTAGVSLWVLVDLLAILAGLWVLFSNYSGLRTAFELSGLDMRPLAQDPVLGWVFDAFGLGEATQADLYAGAVAMAVGCGTFLLFHLLFRALRLWRDRQDYLREGNVAHARLAESALTFTLVSIGTLISLLAVAIYWDFVLFRFRVLAGVLEMDDPGQTWDLPGWSRLTDQAGGNFAIQLARLGAFGYLAVTACISFVLEWAIGRTQEAWAGFEQALVNLFTFDPDPGREQLLVQAPGVVPLAGAERAFGRASLSATSGPVDVPESHEEPTSQTSASAPVVTDMQSPVSIPAPEPPPATRLTVHTPSVDDPEFDVIGGQPGDRVRLSEALGQPDRYVVDPDRRRVWDRARYAMLHGEGDSTTAKAA